MSRRAHSGRPARIARALAKWFEGNRRGDLPWRDGYEPWHVWVSEVMAQQTRMDVAVRRFPGFIARFPTVEAMARASEASVLAAWSGLGYYRRAKMLWRGAIDVVERFGGTIPSDPADLATIPGVGRYTAGAIASIAFDRPAAIVDGNVARLVARLDAVEHPWRSRGLEGAAWEFAESLVRAATSPRVVNQAAMELGARVCRPRSPLCGECPLASSCAARASGREADYPLRGERRKSVSLEIPLYLVVDDRSGRILMQEGSGALMDSMLHLPHGSRALLPDASPESFVAGEIVARVRHTITHRRIEFIVHRASTRESVAEGRGAFTWVDPRELDSHAVPSYVMKALAAVGIV